MAASHTVIVVVAIVGAVALLLNIRQMSDDSNKVVLEEMQNLVLAEFKGLKNEVVEIKEMQSSLVKQFQKQSVSNEILKKTLADLKTNSSPAESFRFSSWAQTLESDLASKGFNDDVRVGLRLMKKEKVPFWMAVPYKLPLDASDINELVFDNGEFYYPPEARIAQAVMRRSCLRRSANGGKALVVDVGANTGYFSLLGLASGCRAIAFDTTRTNLAFLELSAKMNGFDADLTPYCKLVTNEKSVKSTGWNTLPSGKSFKDDQFLQHSEFAEKVDKDMKEIDKRSLIKIDDAVKEDVLYFKVDVEGHEHSVFESAQQLFTKHVVYYLLFEVTYFLFSWNDLGYTKIFHDLVRDGYKLYHIESADPLGNPSNTLPTSLEGIDSWFADVMKGCDTSQIHFCQMNIFAVHRLADWPLTVH